ncbi:hypothetical protein [Actinokineospora bangkokensis]|uniref:Uncharacterized protein n=1 Tax=Actinokineospora bangkokensis TaxID=1193682 RepID=A0A1Q9LES7_9PSEU|nr:hypothetical protein [Actinokineospora bangkokensis]OLR90523.1 hypothetical protein BJP25_28245 [Actinokineospora bangkokensis]
MSIKGLTHPYDGATACSRIYRHGHTFRWAKGDRYVAVMRGTCVEQRRFLIIQDRLRPPVLEGPQPLVDAIPAAGDWSDTDLLRTLADLWARRSGRG